MDNNLMRNTYKQIEQWRQEISKEKLMHINNVTDKAILLHIALEQVKSTLAPVGLDEQSEATVCDYCKKS